MEILLFIPFSGYLYLTPVKVNINQLQFCQLRYPQPGMEEEDNLGRVHEPVAWLPEFSSLISTSDIDNLLREGYISPDTYETSLEAT